MRMVFPLRCSSAVRMKFCSEMPGTSMGFWKDINSPAFARSLTDMASRSSPLNTAVPPVTA